MRAAGAPGVLVKSIHALASVVAVSFVASCGRGAGAREMIQNKGSDTLVNVAQAWAEEYRTVDPSVGIAVSGGGSGTGISAMINGTVHIANSSREMEEKELAAARANGIDPIEHIVGIDGLAVYVHASNPIQSLTLEQLAGIYGDGGKTTHWSQLGVTLPGVEPMSDKDEIIRVSRQNNSGTYMYFQEAVLGKGKDFKLGSRDMPGSKDVVDLVEKTPSAIGYSGMAYKTANVKVVAVAATAGATPVLPTVQTAVDKTYPIARPLFMYTAGQPTGKVKEYLDWILSDAGQKIISDKGYAPVRSL
jgi:phosphate transport system substrate-binding protein